MVMDFRGLLEWRTRQATAGDKGGGGNPLRHRGRGVRPCVWEIAPEQVGSMWQDSTQAPQRFAWTELAQDRNEWRAVVKKFVATMKGAGV